MRGHAFRAPPVIKARVTFTKTVEYLVLKPDGVGGKPLSPLLAQMRSADRVRKCLLFG
jgi:hypothetical protein